MTAKLVGERTAAVRSGTNFTAADFGPWDKLDEFQLEVAKLGRTVRGKVFLKQPLALTGLELSLNKLPPGAGVPFLHKHRKHEELYLFVRGKGQLQVDGEVVEVREGTAIRVGTNGARALRNDSSEPLYFICIQANESSMTDAETVTDGLPVEGKVTWPQK